MKRWTFEALLDRSASNKDLTVPCSSLVSLFGAPGSAAVVGGGEVMLRSLHTHEMCCEAVGYDVLFREHSTPSDALCKLRRFNQENWVDTANPKNQSHSLPYKDLLSSRFVAAPFSLLHLPPKEPCRCRLSGRLSPAKIWGWVSAWIWRISFATAGMPRQSRVTDPKKQEAIQELWKESLSAFHCSEVNFTNLF